jgi:hypothetical protein
MLVDRLLMGAQFHASTSHPGVEDRDAYQDPRRAGGVAAIGDEVDRLLRIFSLLVVSLIIAGAADDDPQRGRHDQ